MSGFTKLVPEIVRSSIWNESAEIRVMWITMLAIKDQDGYVQGDAPTLARFANVPVAAAVAALAKFQEPDPSSHTPDNEGRRIEAAPGGWIILNHALYRTGDRTEYMREYMREYRGKRDKKRGVNSVNANVNLPSASVSVSGSVLKGDCKGGLESDFEAVWKRYPDKSGKSNARKSYLVARREKTTAAEVESGLTRYLAYTAKRRGDGFTDLKYQNGSTWFNQRGWESEYEITAEPKRADGMSEREAKAWGLK